MVRDYDQPAVRAGADAALDRLFTWVLAHGGVITGEHGVGIAKKTWIREALGQVSFHLHKSLAHCLDPQQILNPGKFLD